MFIVNSISVVYCVIEKKKQNKIKLPGFAPVAPFYIQKPMHFTIELQFNWTIWEIVNHYRCLLTLYF